MHRNLPYPFHGRVLDVGYRESEITYQLASLGFETWGIDIRPPVTNFPGVHCLQGDICRYPLPARSFDDVIAISTIEHIGLSVYHNTDYDTDGDLHALRAIQAALTPQGRLLLTVPSASGVRPVGTAFTTIKGL